MDSTARIIEVFPSIQGEGIYVGQPHLFVRFWDCNLSCHYCDTDYRGPFQEWTLESLMSEVQSHLGKGGPYQAVSLTGGEPLLWWKFLKEFLPPLKQLRQRTYLETNGTLPFALTEVLPWIDVIAMDLKPPSATADRSYWSDHEAFLRIAHSAESHPDLFVKIVVTKETHEDELKQGFELVSRINPKIPVVLQPVTPWAAVREAPAPAQLDQWRRMAGEHLTDVRVIPQVHRMLGVP